MEELTNVTTEVTEVSTENSGNATLGGALLVGIGAAVGVAGKTVWDKLISPKIQQHKAAKLNAAQDSAETKKK